VAYLFFAWLVPERSQPEWIKSAKSLSVLQSTGNWLVSLLPDDPENTILKKFKKPKGDEEQDAAPERRTERGDPRAITGSIDSGYGKTTRDGLKNLIESTVPARR
jgi:membrane protein required for colicin V production